jgi:hypothetical protein
VFHLPWYVNGPNMDNNQECVGGSRLKLASQLKASFFRSASLGEVRGGHANVSISPSGQS